MTMKLKKQIARWMAIAAMSLTSAANMLPAFAANDPDAKLNEITNPIIGLINQVFSVLILLVGAVGSIYCISLGIKFAKAEEPQEREKAKQHLKNSIIGFVIIFVLVVALRIAAPNMESWMNAAAPQG